MKLKIALVAVLSLAAVTCVAADVMKRVRLEEEIAREAELGPWYVMTVLPDGQIENLAGWKTREKCEAAIKDTEAVLHSYGSECRKDPRYTESGPAR